MTTFKHTDGRFFTRTGEEPHVTRDGRKVILHVWHGRCTTAGCQTGVTVKTILPNPEGSRFFVPPKYCPDHRHGARIVARREGLDRWRESPEGQAALAKRAADHLGIAERLVYEAAQTLVLVGDATRTEAIAMAVAKMPPPAAGKRDTRQYRAHRAWLSLFLKKRLRTVDGAVVVLR